jgi:hypothetical protein
VTAYIAECGPRFVTINADSTGDRRSRASAVNARKRYFEREARAKLTRIGEPSYSETPGFLSRTSIRYRVYQGTHRNGTFTSGPTEYVGRH